MKSFLDKHSTQEGTWGLFSLAEGEIDFVFLDGQGQELLPNRINREHYQLFIPSASWHKIIPIHDLNLPSALKPAHFNLVI
ncbi:DUF1971 domain-containing protein [Legionella gresilensis]|uniref:DUF1971 domain-containing protein n=1 Tax=Legionella gresilensis TaxID=91823 RepID=UPI001F5F6881|nr:DUF1971 domain-containing protein [Legionella gresilensis]